MPKSALPDHLQDFDWAGTDNASWLMRQKKKLQTLIAASPRVPSGFFKWREFPKTLFILFGGNKGKDILRYESTDGKVQIGLHEPAWPGTYEAFYLSRIQPWCRWHISLNWPLFFNCHFIYRDRYVVYCPDYKSSFGITRMFTFGIGFKRDGDKIYWLTANLGGNFE